MAKLIEHVPGVQSQRELGIPRTAERVPPEDQERLILYRTVGFVLPSLAVH